MFSSFFQAANNSPFRTPFSRVQCADVESTVAVPALGNDPAPVVGREIAAAASASSSNDSCEFGSNKYFALCGIGGILSCGTTHTFVVPLDLVKCRLQVDSAKYKNLFHGFKVTVAEEGARGLAKGWFPTLIGYSAQVSCPNSYIRQLISLTWWHTHMIWLQGLCKFGLYELFKVKYAQIIGDENAYLYRTYLYLAASASAEVFADVALAPFEAAKVKIQTVPGYANTFREAVPKMVKEEGMAAFYKGLVPLWMRQIPYTMMKFACFERTVELLYKWVTLHVF